MTYIPQGQKNDMLDVDEAAALFGGRLVERFVSP
jgi:hypothetical protein